MRIYIGNLYSFYRVFIYYILFITCSGGNKDGKYETIYTEISAQFQIT